MSKSRTNAETLRTVLVAGDVTNANFTGADLEVGKGGTGASSAGAARTALGVAIGSDVLAPDGSAANLTNLPAGGAEDFVASGALPNGKPVILKANGQVEVVGFSPTSVSQAIPAGSEAVYKAGYTPYNAVSLDPSNPSKFVVVYRDQGNSGFGTASVGTVTGTSITFGTATVFHSAATDSVDVSFDPKTSGKCVIAYQDDSTGTGKSVVGSVTGSNISFGSVVQFEAGGPSGIRVNYDGQTANKFMIVYRDLGNSGHATAIVGTVSGTNLSYGSAFVFNAASTNNFSLAANPTTADKYVVSYKDLGNSNYGTAAILTVSGTNISVGSENVFASANTEFTAVAYNPNSVAHFVVIYRDNSGSSDGIAKVGTISGTSISSFSSAVTFSTGNVNYTDLAFDPNTSGKLIASYSDSADSGKGMISVGTLSGTNLTFATAVVLNSGDTHYSGVAFCTDIANAGKFVAVYTDASNSNYGTGIVGQIASTATIANLSATNFLGTATAAYTNGQTASIMLKGGISDNQTSLAIGSTYYVQTNGTFATSAGTPSVLAGKAVSATSLLLNGLDDLQDGGATSINGLTDGYNDNSSLGLGTNALANDDGSANLSTAVGTSAMTANTTGYHNAAIGSFALAANTTGYRHVSVGAYSLYFNTTSDSNTASGYKSMFDTTTGSNNAATGTSSLENNTTGNRNTANGYDSLKTNTTGSNNAAYGMNSLLRNATGSSNTASGYRALENNTTANANTASGMYALAGNTTGTNNTGVGHSANGPSGTQSNTITLGDANVSVLRCNDTSISGLSDRRDKTNITNLPESAGLGIINALRPVTFNWDRREWYDNNTPDGSKIMLDWRRWKAHSGLKYGFIAQEVQATIADEKCMADSNIVSDENLDRIEFAPQHLLTNAIKAIQQLSTENEALKIRLTALENA